MNRGPNSGEEVTPQFDVGKARETQESWMTPSSCHPRGEQTECSNGMSPTRARWVQGEALRWNRLVGSSR